MKKKIIYATIAFISLLASSLPLSAQTPSVTTSGSITSTPDADGNYWFTFESYATGQYIETQSGPEQKTVDVVLVMDCSYGTTSGNSKIDQFYDYDSYHNTKSPTYSNVKNCITTDYYFSYMHEDGQIYKIFEESSGYLYYEVGGTRNYLTNNGSSINKSALSTGNTLLPEACIANLYRRNTNGNLSNDDINTCVSEFIKALQSTSSASNINFSLIRYSGDYYNTSNHLSTNNTNSSSVKTSLVNGLDQVTEYVLSGTKRTIKEITGGGSYSRADFGLQIALDVFNARTDISNLKVVVLVTPNAPGSSADGSAIIYNSTVANDAISKATQLKNSGTSIYTVGIQASKTDAENLIPFLNSVSSYNTNGTRYNYLLNAGGDVLPVIMARIANSIADNSKVYSTQTESEFSCDVEGSSILRNTVSDNFILPSDAATKAKVQYAPCTGGTYGSPTFGAVSDFSTGAPSVSVSDGKLVVTGFNYKDNWAGPSTAVSGFTTYHGGKLVVRIPVTTAADNPGGASVAVGVTPSLTIGETSITALAVSTKVALPNLTLSASGLKSTENALFRVKSTYMTSGSDGVQTSTGASRTFNVMVHGDNPVTLKALPVGTYSITPLTWPWAYDAPEPVQTTALTEGGIKRSFTFTNSATSLHHGEDSSSKK